MAMTTDGPRVINRCRDLFRYARHVRQSNLTLLVRPGMILIMILSLVVNHTSECTCHILTLPFDQSYLKCRRGRPRFYPFPSPLHVHPSKSCSVRRYSVPIPSQSCQTYGPLYTSTSFQQKYFRRWLLCYLVYVTSSPFLW